MTVVPYELLSCSGIYLKWLSAEGIYLTAQGRLVVGCLSGAVIAYHSSSNNSAANEIDSLESALKADETEADNLNSELSSKGKQKEREKKRKIPKEETKKPSKKSRAFGENDISLDSFYNDIFEGSKNEHSKKNKSLSLIEEEREEKEKEKEKDSLKVSDIPNGLLNNVAPELLFGDEASVPSTIYVAGVLITQILTGKQLIKVTTLFSFSPILHSIINSNTV